MSSVKMVGLLVAAGACLLVAACSPNYTAPVVPPGGLLFTQVSHPITTEFEGAEPSGLHTARISRRSHFVWDILLTGISIAWEDTQLAEEARRHGFEKVEYYEHEYLRIFLVYASSDIIAHGTLRDRGSP